MNYINNFEKLNSNGILIWSLPLPISFWSIGFGSRQTTPTKDNGFLLSNSWNWDYSNLCFPGLTDSLCYPPTSPAGKSDVFLVKYSLNGNPQWGKRISGSNYQHERNIAVDSSNNIILAVDGSDTTYYDSIALIPKGNRTAYIIKADSLGNLISYLAFSSSYPPTFEFTDLKTDSHDNIYFMVKTDSDFLIGLDSIYFNIPQNGRAIAIIKLDKNLKYVWSQYVIAGYNDGGTMAIADSIVYVGIYHDVPATLNSSSYQFPAPNSPSADSFIGAIKNTSIPFSISENKNLMSFNIFPNPSTGKFSIQTSIPWQNTEICIFDLTGRCVYHQEVTKPEDFQIDMSKHSKGVYIIEVANAEKRVSQKIVVQ